MRETTIGNGTSLRKMIGNETVGGAMIAESKEKLQVLLDVFGNPDRTNIKIFVKKGTGNGGGGEL